MAYLYWGWVTFKVLLGLWLLSFLIRFFLSYEKQELLREIDEFVLAKIIAIPVVLSNLWVFSGTILYFIGNFTVLLLLAFGIFMLGYSVFLNAHEVEFTFESIYSMAKTLVEDKAAWSGATIIVAATVAVGHMWKLNLDKRQYFEKREKELREEYYARRQRELKRRRSQSDLV
ncbi:MAG: hypothetical protein GXZ10_02235 [Gammaproteobacteria bacterium]|nr:hypothetical protein [Gammaproteobacteria bacterium]